jgi:hypothetical protein
VLAPGLDRAECPSQAFPRRVHRRFDRAIALIDRAESATTAKKARSRLRRIARLLGKTAAGVERVGARQAAGEECVAALSAMLEDGERRAIDLATAP